MLKMSVRLVESSTLTSSRCPPQLAELKLIESLAARVLNFGTKESAVWVGIELYRRRRRRDPPLYRTNTCGTHDLHDRS